MGVAKAATSRGVSVVRVIKARVFVQRRNSIAEELNGPAMPRKKGE